MNIGDSHTSTLTVTEALLASAMGSGNLPVLATPAMIALMENAAMLAVVPSLAEGESTVGSQMNTSHLRPTALGKAVSATATLTAIDGRKLTFKVEAHDAEGNLLGEGDHTRFIINAERFMSKVQ